jgi:hypothetical protein
VVRKLFHFTELKRLYFAPQIVTADSFRPQNDTFNHNLAYLVPKKILLTKCKIFGINGPQTGPLGNTETKERIVREILSNQT